MPHDSREARIRAAQLYLTLSADGSAAEQDQRSISRRLGLLLLAALLAFAVPLGWAQSAGADRAGDGPQAVLTKSGSDDEASASDDDDDEDEDEDEEDADDTEDDGTAGESGNADGTKGQTGQAADDDTNRETQAQNTDRQGLNTGVSTRGETDPGDKTGQTERR